MADLYREAMRLITAGAVFSKPNRRGRRLSPAGQIGELVGVTTRKAETARLDRIQEREAWESSLANVKKAVNGDGNRAVRGGI